MHVPTKPDPQPRPLSICDGCQASVLQRGADQQSFDTLLLGSQPCLLDSGWLWTAFRGLDASDACMPEQ